MQLDPMLHSARVRHQEEKGFVIQASRRKIGGSRTPIVPPHTPLQVLESIVFCIVLHLLWLGLVWSCFVFCLLFLLCCIICIPVLTEGTAFLGLYQIDKRYINKRKHKTLPGISFGSFTCFLSQDILSLTLATKVVRQAVLLANNKK